MTGNAPGASFREGFVEADGFRIRFMEAGDGLPLVYLHGAGGLSLNRGHDLLSRKYRVIAFEMPGFGQSQENARTRTTAQMAATMVTTIEALGVDRFNLMGTSFGGKVALWLAVQQSQQVQALVLEAPAAIRPPGLRPLSGAPEEIAARLYAHPERVPPRPPADPAVQAKMGELVMRVRGPDRDADLEAAMRNLAVPTLVLFGTLDRMIPPEMGRHYKELLPNCSLIFVYDAGHAIGTERPEAFDDVVTDFLDRREAFVINRANTAIHP